MQLERLKEWRESQGLTQGELARQACVGHVTVARAEIGHSVRPNSARKIAEALGLKVSDLLKHPPALADPFPKDEALPELVDEERRVYGAVLDLALRAEELRATAAELSEEELVSQHNEIVQDFKQSGAERLMVSFWLAERIGLVREDPGSYGFSEQTVKEADALLARIPRGVQDALQSLRADLTAAAQHLGGADSSSLEQLVVA
jgi:transcriptional regulator with XRE-family HTH domain